MFLLMIRIAILIALIKILIETNRPFLCAAIYASIGSFFFLLWGAPFLSILIFGAMRFLFAYLYFWLLNRFMGAGALWHLILFGGIFIGLV